MTSAHDFVENVSASLDHTITAHHVFAPYNRGLAAQRRGLGRWSTGQPTHATSRRNAVSALTEKRPRPLHQFNEDSVGIAEEQDRQARGSR